MTGFDANEHLTPFRDARGYGAILFDRTQLRQPDPAWFSPRHCGESAQQVAEGGRGGAWFIQTGEGDAVLRQYLRGGWAASLSRDGHLWRGINRVRSFADFRLLRALREKKLPHGEITEKVKAMLAMVALTKTSDTKDLQRIFWE